MKNIHVLPTDKPSLYRFVNGILKKYNNVSVVSLDSVHIYITDDSKIKEGDWWLNIKTNDVDKCTHKSEVSVYNSQKYQHIKKIILTTDTQLIADGVQAIDDEFLEWFIQNPSCERVEVEGHIYKGQDETEYKIIIPKKNFYCGNQVDYDEQCEFQCDGCVDAKGVDYGWISSMQPFKLKESKSYSKFLSCCRSEEECHCKKEPKQETLEGLTSEYHSIAYEKLIKELTKQETFKNYPVIIVRNDDKEEFIHLSNGMYRTKWGILHDSISSTPLESFDKSKFTFYYE
jgi:hypothetical protein